MADPNHSYLSQLRQLVGTRKLISPGVMAIIQNNQYETLVVQRRDNSKWELPGGGVELGESVLNALQREVNEETGLDVLSATAVAVHSEPRFAFTDDLGGECQVVVFVFRVDKWSGSVVQMTNETVDAQFFFSTSLPDLSPRDREALTDSEQYDGKLVMK